MSTVSGFEWTLHSLTKVTPLFFCGDDVKSMEDEKASQGFGRTIRESQGLKFSRRVSNYDR